uniref:phosphoribosyl-AMP cyclohydrolase n=1 Tax=Oleiphilus messinensis TaxID=141451 RepID=UPI000B3B11EF
MDAWLSTIKWTEDGLIPAIAQDVDTGEVLMMAWMNAESLKLSIQEQRAIYWSRSRSRLWRKGESSGNVQTLFDIRLDCDADVLLLKVKQIGDVACHTGRRSCFYQQLTVSGSPLQRNMANTETPKTSSDEENGIQTTDISWKTVEPVLVDPKTLYSS